VIITTVHVKIQTVIDRLSLTASESVLSLIQFLTCGENGTVVSRRTWYIWHFHSVQQ